MNALATITPQFTHEPLTVVLGANGNAEPSIVISNVNTHASLDADQARALAAVLNTAADRLDKPIVLKRPAGAAEGLRDLEG